MIRRNFLTGIIAAGCAPAIVRAESLMTIWVPKPPEILHVGDGIFRIENAQFWKDSMVFEGDFDFEFWIERREIGPPVRRVRISTR